MLTSNHGNNEGYSMVEAAVSLFITGLLLLVVIAFIRINISYSNKLEKKVDSYIQYKNEYTEKTK